MKNNKTIAEALADEIMNCEKGLPASYAIRKKEETEKMAKGNRWEKIKQYIQTLKSIKIKQLNYINLFPFVLF